MMNINLDTEVGMINVLTKFHKVLTYYTEDLKKHEICAYIAAIYDPIIQNEWKLSRSLTIILQWLTTKILGQAF